MKNIGGIKIIMIAALALIILAGTCAAASLSNSGGGTWKYQREISIKENSGTTLTDHQVLIELKGADFPSETKSDGADVRFTDFSGNELNYWIEGWDYAGKNAKIWVKVPSIAAGATATTHMYYGNPSARSSSNGEITFDFFDDFVGASLNMNKWADVPGGSGSYSMVDGILTLISSGNYKAIKTQTTFSPRNVAYAAKAYSSGHGDGGLSFYITNYYPGENPWFKKKWYRIDDDRISGEKTIVRYGDFDSNQVDLYSEKGLFSFWTKLEQRIDNSVIYFIWDGVQKYSESSQFNTADSITITLLSWQRPTYWDWVFVRKYSSSEPTVTLASPKSSSLSITKSASPYSLRQFQESTIKILIENSGTSEVKAIEIMDSIHPSFDITGGDFPNPKKFDSIRAGETRELQYTIKSKESGAFTLDSATVTYADSQGNIQEVKSEPVSIKIVPSSDGGGSGTNTGVNSKSASVSLHGEKTDVVMGEDIQLRLSAVNLITKPQMHVQVIIIPPSGMSVTSSDFSKSAAGQFTANYQLEPGDGKDIEVRIRSNQVGDFNVNGRIIYYFGDDKDKSEDQTLNLPIKVRKEIASTLEPAGKPTPGFEGVIGISGLLFVLVLIKRGAHE
ncbi:MAG: DUF2341 domain-containing protein [Proteobacteria bacterium]|nr:DUF2341 domain-containing protein [Pseudomonadota bacterium]